MHFTLLIPTYNRRDLLRRCLEAATRQDYTDYEVIVADDASTDGTGEMVRRDFPGVLYFGHSINRGPAASRNLGLKYAGGEVIAFTDDDCLVPPDFLTRLADGYRSVPSVAGVGGYLEPPEEDLQRNSLARHEAYVTHQVYGAGPEPILGGLECPAGGTNSMSYRQDVLAAVGGFDEAFPVPGGEDADLKRRVVEAGGQLLYIPVKVIHAQPYTLARFWRRYYAHGRGAVFYERKYHGGAPTPGRLVLRTGLRLARWAPGLLRLGFRQSSAKLLAELADVTGQWREVVSRSGGR